MQKAKIFFRLCLLFSLILNCAYSFAAAEVSVVVHSSKKSNWNERQIHDLYLGLIKTRDVEVVDQSEGQGARVEFNEKFLKKSESDLKRHWSIRVFSGARAPLVLKDDTAVFEYVKAHPTAIGYLSKEFFNKQNVSSGSENQVIELFSIQ